MRPLATAILTGIFLMSVAGDAQGQQPAIPDEASQFDFWVGEWDLSWKTPQGETQRGTNTISKILDGRVIEERFDGGPDNPLRGVSHSVYSARQKMWKQTWVDNSGGYLDFTGGMADGEMTLSRSFTGPGGKQGLQRMVFFNIQQDSLDWRWESSTDDGKTWTLQWKVHYSRK